MADHPETKDVPTKSAKRRAIKAARSKSREITKNLVHGSLVTANDRVSPSEGIETSIFEGAYLKGVPSNPYGSGSIGFRFFADEDSSHHSFFSSALSQEDEFKQDADDENSRLELLKKAADLSLNVERSEFRFPSLSGAFQLSAAIDLLGGRTSLGDIHSDFDLLAAMQHGFKVETVEALREWGIPNDVLEAVIAPRRTLARRKAEAHRLTTEESDSAWRLAYVAALAEHVLAGRAAAIDWLARPKAVFAGRVPFELLQTSFGAGRVEALLQQLEWGML